MSRPVAIILVLLVLLILLGVPGAGLHTFGYYPSGALFVVLLVVLILAVLGII